MHSSSAIVTFLATATTLVRGSPIEARNGDVQSYVGTGFMTGFLNGTDGTSSQPYGYKCGTDASDKGPFDTSVCAKFTGHFFEPSGCTDGNNYGIFGGNADPWECYSAGTSGVTGYHEKVSGPPGTDGKVYSDACGWLAGTCGNNYQNAIIYPLSVQADNTDNALGGIKIYATN